MPSSDGRSLASAVAVAALVSLAAVAAGVGPAGATGQQAQGLYGPPSESGVGLAESTASPGSLAQTDTANESLDVRTRASPPTPGATSTHDITVRVPPSSNASTLHALELDYGDTGAALGTDLSLVGATLLADPDGNRTRVALENASLSVENGTVLVSFPGAPTLEPGDEVSVAITGVENPPERGQVAVGVALNPAEGGPTAAATFDVRIPAPTISPQGVVGDSTRIGIHDPLGARGFIVAYGPGDEVIGTHALDPEQDLRMDLGIEALVEDDAEENGLTVRLAAHRDSDGDGTFEPGVDEPFHRDGEPVETTVEDAVFSGGTTTTTTTTTSATVTCPSVGFWYEAEDPIRNGTARVDYGVGPDWEGFVVVETVNGTVLGHSDLLAYEMSVNADGARIALETVPQEQRDVRVLAYTDVDGDGAFDPEVDEPCGGGDVSENQFGGTTAGTTPGFGIGAAVLALSIGGLWYRTRAA